MVGTSDDLALELKVEPVEWPVKVLLSIPVKLETVITQLNFVDVYTPWCGPIKIKRSSGSFLCHCFVYAKDNLIWWQTDRFLFASNGVYFIALLGLESTCLLCDLNERLCMIFWHCNKSDRLLWCFL